MALVHGASAGCVWTAAPMAHARRCVCLRGASPSCPLSRRLPCPASVQDVFLPYCQDVRHPKDTLIFYVEHDFRFHERDDQPPAEWLPLVAGEDPVDTVQRPWEAFPGTHGGAGAAQGGAGPRVPESARRGRFSSMMQSVRRSTKDAS
jgi:hypothetical protein